MGSKYTEKADVYSFAMVLFQLLTGDAPFSEEEYATLPSAALLYAIVHDGIRPSLEQSWAGKRQPKRTVLVLYEECISSNAAQRPPFTEIVARLERCQTQL